jgi:hypothetical protein
MGARGKHVAQRVHELMPNQIQNAENEGHMGGPKPRTGADYRVDRAAVSSLKFKAKSGKSKPSSKESPKQTDKGPSKNDGNFTWKDVPPKAGEPTTKLMNGKTYFWCTHHTNPMWALHNPTAFPDLCRLHPKYTEMEAAHKAKNQGAAAGKVPTAADIQLSQALAAVEESDSDDSFEE